MNTSISIAILAGGESKRFGKDKLSLLFGGKTFLENLVGKLKEFSDDIIIIGREYPGFPYCKDAYDIRASIVGIYTALECAKYDYVFVVAGDLPLLSKELVGFLIENISCEYDIVVPVVNGYYEPLVAIYSKRTRKLIKERIISGNFKVSDVFKEVKTFVVKEAQIRKIDKEMLSFFNINTADDYKYLIENFKKIKNSER